MTQNPNPDDEGSDVCGYETPTGPCQNPASEGDTCWINSHGGTTENPGRPSTLEDHQDEILAGARQGMTLQGCARIAGVDESTLHRWIDKHEQFCKSLKRARAQGELNHLQSVNDAGSRFVLERSFGYVKKEKREISGDPDGAPLDVTIKREAYQGDDEDEDE